MINFSTDMFHKTRPFENCVVQTPSSDYSPSNKLSTTHCSSNTMVGSLEEEWKKWTNKVEDLSEVKE